MRRYIDWVARQKWIILGIGLVVAAFFLLDSNDSTSDIKKVATNKEKPMLVMNPDMTEYEGEEVNLKITADKAEIFEKSKRTVVFNPVAKLFSNKNTDNVTIIRANKGDYSIKQDKIRLYGKVRVNFHDGQKLLTEELVINNKSQTVYNSVRVKVISGDDIIDAQSMHYQIQSSILKLKQPS